MRLKVVQPSSSDKPWYSEGLRFSCTQCGNCCTGGPGYVWTSPVEIDRFARYLRMERTAFLKKYCRVIGGKVSLKERKNHRGEYDCVFLEEVEVRPGQRKRVCTVYEVRPLQCRTWPFWDGLLGSKEAWELTAKGCPGMNRGKQYDLEEIQALRDAKDWPGYQED